MAPHHVTVDVLLLLLLLHPRPQAPAPKVSRATWFTARNSSGDCYEETTQTKGKLASSSIFPLNSPARSCGACNLYLNFSLARDTACAEARSQDCRQSLPSFRHPYFKVLPFTCFRSASHILGSQAFYRPFTELARKNLRT